MIPATFIAEFLGTFILMLAVLLAGNPLYIAAGFLAAITIAGAISGAHLNPAVSFGFMVRGDLSKMLFAQYVSAQVLGALAAIFAVKLLRK